MHLCTLIQLPFFFLSFFFFLFVSKRGYLYSVQMAHYLTAHVPRLRSAELAIGFWALKPRSRGIVVRCLVLGAWCLCGDLLSVVYSV